MIRPGATIRVAVEVSIVDPRAFARAAWASAQKGGFRSKGEWSRYRRGFRENGIHGGAEMALREILYDIDFQAAGMEPDIT